MSCLAHFGCECEGAVCGTGEANALCDNCGNEAPCVLMQLSTLLPSLEYIIVQHTSAIAQAVSRNTSAPFQCVTRKPLELYLIIR